MSSGRKKNRKLLNIQGHTISDREDILNDIDSFYRDVYEEFVQHIA